MQSSKSTNPKDAVGVKKVPFSTVPMEVVAELGLAMLEGARKYGRHNYRTIGVRASVYFDANLRHMVQWWEGEDIDPDSGLSHVTKAIASLTVLRDAMINNNWEDDRPPRCVQYDGTGERWIDKMNEAAAVVIEKYPNSVPAYTDKDSWDVIEEKTTDENCS